MQISTSSLAWTLEGLGRRLVLKDTHRAIQSENIYISNFKKLGLLLFTKCNKYNSKSFISNICTKVQEMNYALLMLYIILYQNGCEALRGISKILYNVCILFISAQFWVHLNLFVHTSSFPLVHLPSIGKMNIFSSTLGETLHVHSKWTHPCFQKRKAGRLFAHSSTATINVCIFHFNIQLVGI